MEDVLSALIARDLVILKISTTLLLASQKKPINTTQSNDNGKNSELRSTNRNVVYDDEYKAYLQFKALQASSSATIIHIGNSKVFLSNSSSIGLWVLDSRASDHVLVIHIFYQKYSNLKPPITLLLQTGQKLTLVALVKPPLSHLYPLFMLFFFSNCPFNLIC